MSEYVVLKVKRQENPKARPYWEEFRVKFRPDMNVIAALMDIQKNPVNSSGQKINPVVWECNCLEEVCGACTMIINGVPRQACSALINSLKQPIKLEPLSKFPVVRDLMVDRSAMFEILKKVKAWISIDGTYFIGPGPRFPESIRQMGYILSRCMTCGCCMEACPQVNNRTRYLGPFALAQIKLFNMHPTGSMQKEERLEVSMGPEGIANCGGAENCERLCPMNIPLVKIIAELNREINTFSLKSFFEK